MCIDVDSMVNLMFQNSERRAFKKMTDVSLSDDSSQLLLVVPTRSGLKNTVRPWQEVISFC